MVAGDAVGLSQVVHESPAAGLQPYVSAPEACSVVDAPAQIATDGLTATAGAGFTVMVTWAVPVQPGAVAPVTVYVVVVAGVAVGLLHGLQERLAAGDQV